MPVTRSKHIHAPGILSLAVDQSGNDVQTIFCCSSDETFGLWTCSMDGSLEVDIRNTANDCRGLLAVFGEDIYIAEQGQDVITGNDQHVVVKYGLAAFLSSAPLLMFSLELTALACNGTHLIAGSSDFTMKCCTLDNGGEINFDRYECDAAIVNLSISPDGVHFAVSTADGYVEVRPVVKPSGSAGKRPLFRQRVVNQQFSDITFDCPRMQCLWHYDMVTAAAASSSSSAAVRQRLLFIAGKGGVFVLDTNSWEQQTLLTHAELAYDTFSVLTICPSSAGHSLLAAATLRGALALWRLPVDGRQSVAAAQFVAIHTQIASDLGTITSILFRPSPETNGTEEENAVLLAAFSEGYICSVTEVARSAAAEASRTTKPRSAFIVDDEAIETIEIDGEETTERVPPKMVMSDDEDNGDAPVDANSVIAENDEMEADLGLIKSQFGFDQFGQYVGQTSTNAGGESMLNAEGRRVGAGISSTFHQMRSAPIVPCATVKGMRLPKSFANGATPAVGEGADRYLVWNSHGLIKSYKSNDNESTIEVIFHDATIHSEVIIDNTTPNYVLGDINSDLFALASKSNANKESELYVHHISAWGEHSSRVWTQLMLPDEHIQCLCVGRHFVAVATDARHLRVFTAGGTQRFIVSLAICPLTMAAHEDKLAIAEPTGGVIVDTEDDYEHRISVSVYTVFALSGDFCAPSLDWTCPIPLSPFSRLCWLSFTSCGNLAAMDEECTVRLHLSGLNGGVGLWLPVICGAELLRDPESDFLWPIALQEVPQHHFRHIYCRNSKFPVFGSKSVPETVPWTMPLLNQDSERGKLETELMINEIQQIVVRHSADGDDTLALNAEQSRQLAQLTQNYMSSLLKLFSVSCQLNREGRATEIAYRTTNPKLIQAMCNYASKARRPGLSEKIASVGREHLQAVEAEQQRKRRQQQQQQSTNIFALGNVAALCRQRTENANGGAVDEVVVDPNVNKMLLPKRKVTAGALLDSLRTDNYAKKHKQSAKELLPAQSLALPSSSSSLSASSLSTIPSVTPMDHENDENTDIIPVDNNISFTAQQHDAANSINTHIGCSNTTLNSSSLLLPLSDSMLLDASPLNNPFKKKAPLRPSAVDSASKSEKSVTAASTDTDAASCLNRGFLEQSRDNVSQFVDFFDTLHSASSAAVPSTSSTVKRRKK